ncbi:MAG TPA: DUF1329 domain-containing protein [Syntrophales bacterium]|nr:DUF1329 domain-containing protein [Syntrophales bacterium]
MKKMKKMVLLATLIIGISLVGKNFALAGELIDKNNWQKVKDTLIHTRILEDVKKGIYTVNVVPAKPCPVPKYFDELTQKYAGQAKLTPSGHLPNSQYHGGTPFPNIDLKDPQAAKKIMWNFAWRYQGDDFTGEFDRFCFDNQNRKVDAGVAVSIMRAVGRGIIPPTPTIPGDEDLEIYYMTIYTYPRDASGTVTLAVRPSDPNKYDSMSRFFPSVRRVRRLPSTERYMSMPPTIFIMDDTLGYSSKMTHFNHRLLGDQKILVPTHIPPPPAKYKMKPGYPFPLDLEWELRDSWVIEDIPRPEIYPKYAYSKRIIYIDKEHWGFNAIKAFDRKGEYWKDLSNTTFCDGRTKAGDPILAMYGNTGCSDLQTGHVTVSQAGGDLLYDYGLNRDDFGIDKLLTISRMGRIRVK